MSLFCQQVLVTLDQHEAHLSVIRRPGSTNHTLILLSEVWHKLSASNHLVSTAGFHRARRQIMDSNSSYHHEDISLPLELCNQLKSIGSTQPLPTQVMGTNAAVARPSQPCLSRWMCPAACSPWWSCVLAAPVLEPGSSCSGTLAQRGA